MSRELEDTSQTGREYLQNPYLIKDYQKYTKNPDNSIMKRKIIQFLNGQRYQQSLQITNAGEAVEKNESSYTVGEDTNWYSHSGKQYGGSLKN